MEEAEEEVPEQLLEINKDFTKILWSNLKELDEKIGLEKYNLEKKLAIKADRAAQRTLEDG